MAYVGVLTQNLEIICAMVGMPRAFAISRACPRRGSLSEFVATSGVTQILSDVHDAEIPDQVRDRFRVIRARSMVAAPLRIDGEIVGAVNVLDARPRDFEPALAAWIDLQGDKAAQHVAEWSDSIVTTKAVEDEDVAIEQLVDRVEHGVAELAPLIRLLELAGDVPPDAWLEGLESLGPPGRSYDALRQDLDELIRRWRKP